MAKKKEKVEAEIIAPTETNAVGSAVANAVGSESSSKEVQKQVDEAQKNIAIISNFIKSNLKEGTDFGSIIFHSKFCANKGSPTLKDGCDPKYCKSSKPFLQKPGSEKFVILFKHRAQFTWMQQDFTKGLFAVKCMIVKQDDPDHIVGEGYGSARVSEKTSWTENEAMKIACKRAQIDASLRTYGLSDHFTQDLDDVAKREAMGNATKPPVAPPSAPMASRPIQAPQNAPQGSFTPKNPNAPMSDAQNRMIFALIGRLGKDKAWLERWILSITGVEKIERLSMSWASKIIEALKKKADSLQGTNLPTVDIDAEKKREPDLVSQPRDVDVPDDLDAFDINPKVDEEESRTEEL